MGIENMRRWPLYVIFAVCILLAFQLFNSWGIESDLRYRIGELSSQLQVCTKQQKSCIEQTLELQQQRESYRTKLEEVDAKNGKLNSEILESKNKASKAESRMNRTVVDVEFCKAELQSLKNLQLSQNATLETLRLKKDTLTAQLKERKQKIDELEKEIEKLKAALTTKSAPNPSLSSKITPAVQQLKLSPVMNANNALNEPVLENNAKEEFEDLNIENNNNEVGDFDTQLQ